MHKPTYTVTEIVKPDSTAVLLWNEPKRMPILCICVTH